MFQNLKVDIIYYNVNSDFELEFNLSGCCRMRLLTDKATDRKSFIHELARGVSRSRIIIAVGNLFGAAGTVETVSGAIGKRSVPCDSSAYGIRSDGELNIISGSTPLVTPDGCFGGCIIESGPQTIILLSENKSVRKTIMSTLIHPYVEELSAMVLKEKAAAAQAELNTGKPESSAEDIVSDTGSLSDTTTLPPAVPADDFPDIDTILSGIGVPHEPEAPAVSEAPVESEAPAVSEAPAESENPIVPDASAEPAGNEHQISTYEPESDTSETSPVEDNLQTGNDAVTLSSGMSFSDSDGFITGEHEEGNKPNTADLNAAAGLVLEPSKVRFSRKSYYDIDYSLSESDSTFLAESEEPPLKQRRSPDKSSLNLVMLILAVLLLITLAVLCYCVFLIPAKYGMTASEYLKDTFSVFFVK